MVTSEKQNAEMLQLLPCPFCGSQIEHVKSWAKSFQPNRLYHEWHHVADNIEICPVRRNIGKIVASATDDSEMRDDAISRWNNRTAAPSPHPRGEPVAWQTAKVSIDVSTCDADAGRRVFGRVVDWQPEDYDGEKAFGLRLLCEYEGDNFGLRDAPPPAGADAVTDEMLAISGLNHDWNVAMERAGVAEDALQKIADGYGPQHGSKYCRDIALAALTPPQPQEKPTGDKT